MSQQSNAWICTVCGYIHYGTEAPDVCPVCGATSDLFDPYNEPADQSSQNETVSKWRCLNCEYVHDGESPPDICPVCGAPAERFEPHEIEQVGADTSETTGNEIHVVIVGAGIAGVSAAESVRKQTRMARVTMLSKEEYLPYYRLNLTRYLAGEVTKEQLPLHPEDWYRENKISLQYGMEATGIDVEKKVLHTRQGQSFSYDKLVLATGSHPFVPPFPGAQRDNVTSLRSVNDADFILEQCKLNKLDNQDATGVRVVVIGGGVLGLETAGALGRKGVDVTLLEGHEWLMPRQLNRAGAEKLEAVAKTKGIKVLKRARTTEIMGDECVREVLLSDGRKIPADLVIVTTGVRSNSYLGRLAGLEVNKGVVVNNHLQCSQPDIFAAGDVAEHHGVLYGTWGPSQFQGTMAGTNAVGGSTEFAGIPRSNMLKVLGFDMFSIGQISGEDASYHSVDMIDGDNYYFFHFRDNHMIGSILLGETELSAKVKHMVEAKIDCSQLVSSLADASAVLECLRS